MKSSDEKMVNAQPLGAPIRTAVARPVHPEKANADGTILRSPDGRLSTNLPTTAPAKFVMCPSSALRFWRSPSTTDPASED